MTKKRLPLLLASALLLAPVLATDQVRDVQGALKSQGFFYGEVTGAENAETGAAIRRFQIRSGITVTGKLNADTLAALGLGEKKPVGVAPQPGPAPAPRAAQPTAPVPAAQVQKQVNPAQAVAPKPGEGLPMKSVGDLPSENESKDTEQKVTRRANLNDPSVIEPPAPLPAPVSTPFSTMFRDTPYATAPREVQMDVVLRAQAFMAARKFYRGPLNGIAGPLTSEAIFIFQQDAGLPRTGRLDPDTLAEMKLLPQTARGNPLLKPFYNPNRRRDRSVLSE